MALGIKTQMYGIEPKISLENAKYIIFNALKFLMLNLSERT